jgi:hypothetical protein
VDHLKRAFQILDPEVSTGKDTASKDVENFSQSLYVECAEKAINVSFSLFSYKSDVFSNEKIFKVQRERDCRALHQNLF